MRKLGTLAFIVGLAVWVNVDLANDAMATMHGQAGPMAEDNSGPMLMMPMMNPARGRKLFAGKGCVVCHSINGVGGEDAPQLDIDASQPMMNPFDFAARMWRGAEAMISLQRDELGEQIEFSGRELGDIIAFVHDPVEQKKFSTADIPPRIKELMRHMGGETEEHEKQEHDSEGTND